MRILSWFSCGAASTIATALIPGSIPVYCDPGSEHPDNDRYLTQCEEWFGRAVVRLHSEKYHDTWDVWAKRRYLAGIEGALCTVEMKVIPRLSYQRPDDHHVFGYTADSADVTRANRMRATYPEMTILTPLIERGLTKASCVEMVRRAGIEPPPMYELGFSNNNCIPCVKATSPSYWALVRAKFPAEFKRMASLSRELDVRLCRINGERVFIDEIPENHPVTAALAPACDFLCHLAEQDINAG